MGADIHQRATFILYLAANSRYTTSFLDITCLCRTLFCDTTDQSLLHFILVTTPVVVTLVQLKCKGNAWSSCFHMFIALILCYFNNIMQDMRL